MLIDAFEGENFHVYKEICHSAQGTPKCKKAILSVFRHKDSLSFHLFLLDMRM